MHAEIPIYAENRGATGGLVRLSGVAILAGILSACTHTVRVEAPTEPIVINLNVKIDQEVRVRLAEDIEKLIGANPDIF